MDTVSMLNKMSFYCQPILPLVYDESMSYYETLCKVVGQLNTTGETVNKLNEGLTGEIADRQAADALLDERLKVIEATSKKIHFLVFAGTPPHNASPIGNMPTRSELRQWVNDRDMIVTILETREEGRNSVYAASCAYNAGNLSDESFDDFNIIVPISTSYDSEGDYAVRQKIAKITIPPSSASSLGEKWGLQVIEINTPSTSANGVVNFAANIFDDGHMECNLTPVEFMNLYAPTWANRNLCVAVNAKLFYDGYTRTSSIATLNSTNHLIRIAFERDYGTSIENGVNQLNKTTDYIIGNVSAGTWTHESIDSKVFDFPRYEGFQFTRGAHNVITTDDESTPNAVYTQYHANASGKLYQNLPTRLIDTVDGAEYWNGTFDINDNKHMTFTFVTSNYATASDKMLVRVIELSADVNTTTWKYAEKEFTIPLSDNDALYVDFWPTGSEETYNEELKAYVVELASNKTFDEIYDSIKAGHKTVARLYQDEAKSGFPDSSVDVNISGNKTLGTINFHFLSVDSNNIAGFAFIGEVITLIKTSSSTRIFISLGANALPVPNGDGTDNGKVPTVNGSKWGLKELPVDTEATEQAAGLMSAKDKKKLNGIEDGANKTIVDEMLSDGSTNPVQNKAITAALASVAREFMYPIAVTATSTEWAVNNGIAYKEASADRTFDNIRAAYYNNNKIPVCVFDRMTYSMVSSSSTEFVFASYRGAAANDSQYAGLGKYPTSLITINTTGVVISRAAGELPAVDGADNDKMLIVVNGEWAMQSVPGTTVDAELSTTSENPVQNKTVTDALNGKLPKTGGTVTGALRTNDSFSAGGTISFGEAPISLSQTDDGAAEIRYGSADANDNPPPLSRLKVARPTADDDAATKKYVDDRNYSPQFKGYVTLTPANAPIGTGVGLSPSVSGNDFTLDISDVNEGTPTKLTGVKTPTDTDTNAAATVEYVKAKVASGGSNDFVVNGTVNSNMEVTLDKTFAQIQAALQEGKHPAVHITGMGDNFLPLVNYDTDFVAFAAVADVSESAISSVGLYITADTILFDHLSSPTLNSDGAMNQKPMEADPISPMEIATKKYVDDHLSGAPITIKLGTGNAATSTATFAEIKAALEVGKAPILDSAPGTNHWFALNWMLSGSDSLTIQYGTFNVGGGGMATFTIYDVDVSSTGITYARRQFTTE